MRPSVAFISIYSIAWVKLTIKAARSDTATSVRPVFLLARRAKEGQSPRCAADSAPRAGEALGGPRLLFHPFPKPAPSSDAPLPLCTTCVLTLSQRLQIQTATKTGCLLVRHVRSQGHRELGHPEKAQKPLSMQPLPSASSNFSPPRWRERGGKN